MRAVIVISVALLAVGVFASCPACDATACAAAICLPNDPYYCESGASKGGCAANPDAWNNTKFCTKCCSLASCPTRFSCTGQCSSTTCEAKNRCSIADPYMCLSGTAQGGCSANATFWPTQHMCDSCCDVKSCVHKCPPCTATQCKSNVCSALYPYVCTAGPLKNGCSNSSMYFPDQSQCFACCDSAACPTPAPSGSGSGQEVRLH